MAKNKTEKASPNTVHTKRYETFLGVDFSKDASMVDDEHSPYAQNLISDADGFPEKRLGWRTMRSFDSRINGIFRFGSDDEECIVVHAGSKLYKLDDDGEHLLISGIADNISTCKYFKGKLCILTGSEYLVFDGEKCIKASDAENMYAPSTVVSRETAYMKSADPIKDETFITWNTQGVLENYDGTAVALGMMPEGVGVNLVSGKRRNCFDVGSGFALFVLDAAIDAGTRVKLRCIATDEVLFDVVYDTTTSRQYYNGNDGEENVVDTSLLMEMKQSTAPYNTYYTIIGNSEKNNCGYVICKPNKEALTGYTHLEGTDDFEITYTHAVEGYAERISGCRFLDVFENRVFFSGNPDYPNADWYSGVNDPLYVPDTNYTEIGMDSSSVMGYLRTGDKQAILKSDGDGATIYMRSYSQLADGGVLFPIKQGISGIGAISERAICTFLDDPVYLTRNGVYAIALQDISSERALNIRSTRINSALLRENGLSDAVMCEWDGYMLLCVNGKAYVASAARKSYPTNATGTFEYEWYYWTNIPARVLSECRGELFFGTEDGRICKFSSDLVNERGERLSESYSDDGEAIVAEWATNLSDDGNFMQKKTLVKVGSGVMLKSYNRSGVTVLIRTERDFGREAVTKSAGIFNFDDLDFSDFTFNTAPYLLVPFNTRVKKYGAIQIICRNEKPNHAFGIGGIVRRYFYGRTKKQ